MPDYTRDPGALFHPERRPMPTLPARPSVELLGAAAARIAYLGDAGARARALAAIGAQEALFFDDPATDTQGLLATHADGWLIAALRGTQPWRRDVLIDAMAWTRQWAAVPGAQVHSGFALAAHKVLTHAKVGPALAALRPERRLLICGHSLGGALAVLLASAWGADRLVTIGCPRVGDAVFARTLDARLGERHTRIVQAIDLVPMVPPGHEGTLPPSSGWQALWSTTAARAAMAMADGWGGHAGWDPAEVLARAPQGYQHAGQRLYIDRLGRPCPGATDVQVRQDQFDALTQDGPLRKLSWLFTGQIATRLLSDHTPDNYLSALRG
ncbi:lipase family protein [Ideonella sp. 4Y16]|uniref:lipase family protein n=1 Tax=Ideonella alba TaxID=2824118 RepID=UPI001B358703|nr:lipase family protein [Ideonella alba]MBQ0946090.1 lipase family protein [Ideonella alba]